MVTLVLPKVRGFVIDESSGHPVAGVLVSATAQLDDKRMVLLALLQSDPAGYFSFDFSAIADAASGIKHLWIATLPAEDWRVDALAPWNTPATETTSDVARPSRQLRWPCVPIVLRIPQVPAKTHMLASLPSVQNPDLCDWELSPRSFSAGDDLSIGEGECEQLVPVAGIAREFTFQRVIRIVDPENRRALGATEVLVDASSPVPLDAAPQVTQLGYALEFRQRWLPLGHSLGNIVYSLPLAPCESVNVAVIDWSRRDTLQRVDVVRATEALFHSQRRDRAIEETVAGALKESQAGWSLLAGVTGAQGTGSTTSGSASATVPIYGIPVSLAGAATSALSLAQMFGIGGGVSSTWGDRDVTAESLQQLHDRITQTTSAVRTLSSTVVIQATQEESNTVQTRTVTNHNHCHALTVQYYEVLRNFKIVTEFVRRRPVVLVPYKMLRFDWSLAMRFRAILELVLLDPSLADCFNAVARLHRCGDFYETLVKPAPTVTTPSVTASASTPEVPAPTDERTVDYFKVTLRTTDWNWSTTWGAIWVDVYVAGTWTTIWSKDFVHKGAPELNKMSFPSQVSGQSIMVKDLGNARVQWQEDNGNDSWDFKGITIYYKIAGEQGEHNLIDYDGPSVPTGSKSNKAAIKFFDDSGSTSIESGSLSSEAPPPFSAPTPASTTPSTAPSTTTTTESTTAALTADDLRDRDTCCEAQLLGHLNDNAGYYNRAVWLLRDPVEHRVALEAALAPHANYLDVLDDTPLAVSGRYVAYAYREADEVDDGSPEAVAPQTSIVSLPTRGLFAEAQLGHCNACEVRDVTRFWKWDESSCPPAPTIEGITPGPKGTAPQAPQPVSLPSPVVQITQAASAPDPVGLAAAIKLLGTPDVFRDMSGMTQVAELLKGLASGTVDLAKAQIMANDAQTALAQGALGGSGSVSRGIESVLSAAQRRQSPEERYDNLQVAKEVAKSADELGLSDQQKSDLSTEIVGSGGGGIAGQLLKSIMAATPTSAPPPSVPGIRWCCQLGIQWAIEPADVKGHAYGSTSLGNCGYVYTERAGLLDIGHIRDHIDLTKYVREAIVAGRATIPCREGTAVLTQSPTDPILVAQTIAYVDSWAHELVSFGTVQDFSAFAPEDLPSNFLGTMIGAQALAMSASSAGFDAVVDTLLSGLLASLGARPKADTDATINSVKGNWWEYSITTPPVKLLRRNFESKPWLAGATFDKPPVPSFIDASPLTAQFGAFEYTSNALASGSTAKHTAFATLTSSIRVPFAAAGTDKP